MSLLNFQSHPRQIAYSNEICLAIKRIFVHEKIFEQFRDAMVKHTKTLKLGEGHEEGVFLGPIQNSMQYERVKGFFSEIDKENWNVAVGGENPDGPGYFITPTIIDRPKEDSRLVVEEPFGESQTIRSMMEIILKEPLARSHCAPALL